MGEPPLHNTTLTQLYNSTPDKPVHCIEWAKHLHMLMFGHQKDSILWDDTASGGEGAAAAAAAVGEGGAMEVDEVKEADRKVKTVIMDAVKASDDVIDDATL